MKKFFGLLLSLAAPLILGSMCRTRQFPGESNPKNIWALEFSHNDEYFAVGGDDSTLFIYTTSTYGLYKKYKLNSMIRNIAWHNNDKVIAVSTLKDVQLLDVKSGKSDVIPGIR